MVKASNPASSTHEYRVLPSNVNSLCPAHARVTRISFRVKVPVLSVKIVVAPPIVSHAPRYRTRLLSSSIRLTVNKTRRRSNCPYMKTDTSVKRNSPLKASASVTARGKPSGTATTTTVTPVMTKRRYCSAISVHVELEPATSLTPLTNTPLRNNRCVYDADMASVTKAPA